MKSCTLALTVLVSLVTAQQTNMSNLPACAQSCVTALTKGTTIGGCPQLQIACICSAKSFLEDISCCVVDACQEEDIRKAITFASQICGTAGVKTPTEPQCPSKMPGGHPTGTPTSTPTSTVTPTQATMTPTSAPTHTPSAASPLNMPGPALGVAAVFGGLLMAVALF